MKKTDKKPRPVMLGEVRVTATRIQKPKPEMVKLYPRGEVAKRSVDSLKKVGLGKAIGNPVGKSGTKPTYGTASSDVIRKALKKK